MLEAVVVCKKGLVVMHMMCCTAVFDPYSIYFSNTTVDCRFAAVCETTEYCIVGGSSAIISICICQIRCLWIISTSTASMTSSSATATTPFIVIVLECFPSLLSIVFFSDTFVAVLLGMVAISTVAAWKK